MVSEPIESRTTASDKKSASKARPKILYLGSSDDSPLDLTGHFGDDVEVVKTSSPVRALARLARSEFAGVYVDADHFAEAADVGRLIQHDRILQAMPSGVVLLDGENTILWGNGRLREWCGCDDVVGEDFYRVLRSPEILGPDFCPFHTALSTRQASATTLRCADNCYYRMHAAPVLDGTGDTPQHLVVTLHDVSEEVLQQQKLAAIYQAGVELADLTTDEVASLSVAERIELFKSNILHCMQNVLHIDVIEIRMLDQATGKLDPIMAEGMELEATQRELYSGAEGNGVTGFVAATGKSYICEHIAEDPLYIAGAKGARSSLTVPLMLHEEVIGTLNVESPEANAFSESDLQFLEIFARNVALALNTLELLAAEKASTAAASVEAIHSAVALPVDDILNDAVNVMEQYIGHEPDVVERLRKILRNARDIKQVIQKVGQHMAPVQAQPSAAIEPLRPKLVGTRVLVVDVDDTVRSAAHELLERYDCTVETAHNGQEACYMVRNLGPDTSYDVIIADIRLPDMSGYDLLVRLKGVIPQVPLVLMTGFGYDPEHSVLKARQEGVQFVLYKPFRLDQLISTIEDVVAQNNTCS